MKSGWYFAFCCALFVLVTDCILWLFIRKGIKYKWLKTAYWAVTLLFIASAFLYQLLIPRLSGPELYRTISLIIGVVVTLYFPKAVCAIAKTVLLPLSAAGFRRPVNIFSAFLFTILFALCLFGFTAGRYSYKINRSDVSFANLPDDLRGLRIAHISDLHLGSVSPDYKGYERLVEKVNAEKPDLILFSGDIVNNFAEEIEPFIPVLQKFKARYGVYGVTGNHDYGSYVRWKSPDAKAANFRRLIENEEAAGIRLLMNENVKIKIGRDTLMLAGVENWGKPPFPQYGDIDAALKGRDSLFTVLLSHDPSHWRAQVLGYNVPLTLSGHTHAMQAGISLFGFKWSPSKYIYPEYDGLYREGECCLNVSRGAGYIGLPGRIGLRPAIDILTLTKSR